MSIDRHVTGKHFLRDSTPWSDFLIRQGSSSWEQGELCSKEGGQRSLPRSSVLEDDSERLLASVGIDSEETFQCSVSSASNRLDELFEDYMLTNDAGLHPVVYGTFRVVFHFAKGHLL